MKFNTGTLAFMKMKKDANKDEMFAVGYLIGLKDAFEKMASVNGVEKENIDDVVKEALNEEAVRTIWNELENGLELNLRSPEVVGVLTLDKEN